MKKGPIILLVIAMSLTMSVAASIADHSDKVVMIDDVGDTKVVKFSDFNSNVISLQVVQQPELIICDVAVVPDRQIMKPVLSTSVRFKKQSTVLKRKIYLLNCSIRQCSRGTVAAD